MIVPEVVLQLLMEKECMCFLITELVSANIKDQPATDQSAPISLDITYQLLHVVMEQLATTSRQTVIMCYG